MAGFVMPRIDARYKLYDICRSGPYSVRAKLYSDYTWKDAVWFACKLAWITGYLHEYNIVIGDFNSNNIVVDTLHNTMVLIDCDSFNIIDFKTGEHFPCTVGVQELLALELQSGKGSFYEGNRQFFSGDSYFLHSVRVLRRKHVCKVTLYTV